MSVQCNDASLRTVTRACRDPQWLSRKPPAVRADGVALADTASLEVTVALGPGAMALAPSGTSVAHRLRGRI